ncbi:radical SAM protein [Fulvivirga sp. M361]|uniref:radical SAM protein n=1 Tax=Fulvivirga sp. M361 TaxID=2594266 RepID=UPI00117A0376|nr:radical SAM protein [Fulvivirga sp. M361]TRX58808.1 radical SAM protein [Fulvivirga sp. M361]
MRLISHPVLCNYYVTYRCNAKCAFCDIWERPSPYVELKSAEANFAQLKKLGVKVIDFTGGEPLLHREIDKLLEMAKSYGFITTLTTNGLLYPKWAEKLAGKIDMLHFSLDSATREEHDASRGVACFDILMNSIALARALGERPDILFTAMENNIDQIETVYTTLCRPNGLVLILNPIFDYNQVESGPSLSNETLDKLSSWGKRKGVYLNDGFIQLRRDGGNNTHDPVCKAASSTVVISPENQLVLPCYHLGLKAFNIDNNLYELYQSEEVQQLVALEGRLPECEGCTINCYMQPSFAVELNKYWWKALPSTLKYNRIKGTWKELLKI